MKLGEPGYKDRYYSEKFGISKAEDIDEVRRDLVSFLIYFFFTIHFIVIIWC